MKFKLDENFGTRTRHIFEKFKHDVCTVHEQNLSGTDDGNLFSVCRQEHRCLVTLDLDFSDVLRFPPQQSAGIVIIRVPRNPTLPILEQLVSDFLTHLADTSLTGALWIVEPGRIRVHQRELD